jgi:CUG-BP- and ETR3-like factor
MGSGSSYQHTYASGESGYGMYPSMAGMPAYPYSQAYPEYQSGRGYGPPGGRFGGQRRPRHNTSYASVPGPPIVQPGGAKGPDGANLFVFHIPNDFSNQEMYDMFAQYGNVLSARIMVEAETGRSRGFGFVSFDSTAAAANAIKHLNGYPVSERPVSVILLASCART